MKNIKWIFFDIGTTLINEEKAYNHRIYDMTKDTDISVEEFEKKKIEFAKLGLDGNSAAIKFFNLNKTPWHFEDEMLYEDTIDTLEYLKGKNYKLGIIANQKLGLGIRLEELGILKYFDLIIASQEVGVSKPNKDIFNIALSKVNCKPYDCVMIGDRLDNDIVPAKQVGMKVIWIRQGLAKYQEIKLGIKYTDFIVNSLIEIKDIL